MFTALSVRHRLLLASGLILALAALASWGGLSASGSARWLLGAVTLAGLGWWWSRRVSRGPRFALPERLRVISRAGLSQRCGVALVEADGRGFLVAYGDSFAEIRVAPGRRRMPGQARRPVSRRRASVHSKGTLQ
jgi:flagellar protein FliO/FliZ